MDDNSQQNIPLQNQPVVPAAQPVVPSVSVSQPAAPTGSMAKEHGPVAPPPEVVAPADSAEQLPTIDKELAEAGVEHVVQTEHPKLTVEDTRAGLEVTKASVPVSQVTGTAVTLPMPEEKALAIQKSTSLKESLRWLAEEVLREIKKTHQNLTKKDVK